MKPQLFRLVEIRLGKSNIIMCSFRGLPASLSSVVVLARDLSYMYIVHVQDDDWSPVSRTSAPCLSNYTLVAHLDSAADMAAVAAITASNVTVPGWVRSRCDAPLHGYRLSR